MNEVKRGFVPTDSEDFSAESINTLRMAGEDVYFLLNRDYPIKNAVTFVGNRYQLSERQRTAIARIVSPEKSINARNEKKLSAGELSGKTVHIDGFNIIITLETAFSGSVLFRCMDSTIRDLAGLRGSYRLIDKTDTALQALADAFTELGIAKAVFYLDKPVSNSGRLKKKILDSMTGRPFETEAITENAVDSILENMENVITADAIILDRCGSWFNINDYILKSSDYCQFIDISGN